jgi:hypothetical protein
MRARARRTEARARSAAPSRRAADQKKGGSLVLACALLSCTPPTAKGAPAATEVHASKIEPPDHVTLQMACTPTGPELCFNAIDDNCNGIIDEGCGVGTGVLQFTIAWREETADVNLRVTDPSGGVVDAKQRATRGGLRLDRDCPGVTESCGGQNTENVFFEGLDPPRGHYKVEVALGDPHGAALPIIVHFGARIGSQTHAADLSLSPGEGSDRKTFGYEL